MPCAGKHLPGSASGLQLETATHPEVAFEGHHAVDGRNLILHHLIYMYLFAINSTAPIIHGFPNN